MLSRTFTRRSLNLVRPTSSNVTQRSFNEQNRQRNTEQSLAPRFASTYEKEYNDNSKYFWGAAAGAFGFLMLAPVNEWFAKTADYKKVREDIENILDNENYDDGSYGPVFIRLAWHSSGTYSTFEKNGGSNGANMRFAPEKDHGANAGLNVARDKLEAIKKKHPDISYADLYVLASIVAIEHMGGPKINFYPGRSDSNDNKLCTPDGRLPDASKGRDHIRAIFYRMGLNDEEMVALIGGGHAIGRCHTDRSGYSGPWTNSPTVFTNDFFVQLFEQKWTEKKWNGPLQYEDPSGQLMMLPTDLELRDDPVFRGYSEKFAKDEDYFFKVFANAYEKLTMLGTANLCPRPH